MRRDGSHIRMPIRNPKAPQVSTNVSSWLNFTPLSLQPALWLDASDISTITSSSGAVSQWADKSGNGRDVSQGTAAAQPTSGTRTLNGLNVIDFDGGDSLICVSNASTWKFLQDGTKYIVCLVVKRDTSGTNGTLLSTGTAFDSNSCQIRFLAANTLNHLIIRTSTIVPVDHSLSVGTSLSEMIFTIFADPSNTTALDRSIIFRDLANGSQTNTTTATPTTNDPPVSLTIGNRQVNALPFDGFIAEIIILQQISATLNNLVLVRNYLSNKWGIIR